MLSRRIHSIILLLALLIGAAGMNYVQAAPMARAMWDLNTKTLTFYYGEQKSGGTNHYSGTQITATGSTAPEWCNYVYSAVTTVVFESTFASVRPTSCYAWFRNMSKLTTITGINYLNTTNVTNMNAMFYGCSGLTSLDLSSFNTTNVTNMAYMFYGCSGLTSLNLSSFNTANVTYMSYMFNGCSGLTSLDLSSFNTTNVTNMNFMFRGCSNLQIIYVDESKWSTAAVTYSTDMFAGCYKLVGGNGTVFNSSYTNRTRACIDKPGQVGYLTCATAFGTCGANGDNLTWLLSCDGTLTISGSGAMADYTSSPQPWASYISYINSVVLPEGITSIGIRAFKNHTALSSINLPSTLTNIGLEAFRATALTSVEIPSGMQWINYWTFKDCASLTTVRLPASITSLPTPGAFCGCTSLQFVYVSWETASQIPTCSNTSNFFHDLTTKPTLYVPCGTISLYQNKGWNNKFTITDVLLSGTCGSNLTWSLNTCGVLTISGTGAMSNYPGMNMPWRSRRASITSVVISDGVTSIGYNAFNGCSNLTSVTIPPSVTSIEQNAFYGCYAMESLYITDLAAWCNVEFGVSVEATPFMRNNYNSGSTEYLGGGNLYLNGTLVTTLTIPDGITEIKNLTFLGCSSITSIDFNQVTTIGSASFKGCHGLTSVTLPEGVTSLQNAFPYCTQLQSISIPASLTSLARQTLYHSDALTDIYVYWTDNIPGWKEYFTSKSPQSSITLHVPCGKTAIYQAASGWKNYTITDDVTLSYSGTCGAAGHESDVTWSLDLCDSILTISGTGEMADYSAGGAPWYEYKDAIHTVTFADGINTIGENAFAGFTNLTDIYAPWTENIPVLPASNNPQSSVSLHVPCIATGAYQTADGWKDYTITPEYTASGTCGAQGSNVTWTYCDGVLTISGTGAMKNYTYADANTVPWYYFRTYNITSIVIEEGVTSIGDYVFFACSSVTSVTIPNSVTSIGNAAFRNCSSLASITIPETVLTIGKLAFQSCPALTSITFPNSVTSIGNAALNYCSALEDIYVSWTENIPYWDNITNRSPQSDITLHIPCGTEELYNAADGWKDYTIVEDMPNIKSGTYGPDNIEWSFDYCDSLLSITGNGELRCDNNNWGPNAGGINPNLVKRVFVGKGVTYLGIYTLSYMSNIEYIEVEAGHPTLRTGCNAIIRIGTEQEGDTLIFGCPHTVIPTTCTTIRGYAFWDDHLVTEMTIPSSVRQIANMQGSLWQGNNGQVFYTSNNTGEGLKDLYVEWTKLEDIPEVLNNKLGDMTKVRLHVPCGTTALYKQVTGWKNFKEYIEEATSYTVTVQAEDPTMGDVSITVNP